MPAIGTAHVDIKGDFSSLHRQLAGTQSKFKQLGGRLARPLGIGIAAGAGVGAAGLYGLGKAASASVEAYEESRKAGARVNAILKATGGVANVSGKQVDRLS